MTFTLAFALLDSGAGEIAYSPFIVPVTACLTGLGCVVASFWAGVRRREMQSQERLAAIAAGQPIPPSLEELAIIHGVPTQASRRSDGRGSRKAGIVLVSAGFGLVVFFVALAAILQTRAVLCGGTVGLIPIIIGLGFLIDARINAREASQEGSSPEVLLR